MATDNQNKQRSGNKSGSSARSGSGGGSGEDSAFSWGGGGAGVLAGAALAGAAMGIAANVGRKLFVQMSTGGASGDWFDALKAEHKLTLAIFDRIEATDDSQGFMRAQLLMKLKYALTKHANEEENVIYPALREANLAHDADALNSEHGYVKTYLYELDTIPKTSPEWLARVRDFRSMIQEHIRMEEDEVYPTFRKLLSETQNARLTSMMNKEGFKLA